MEYVFQSTLPRRERLGTSSHSPHCLKFQSTLPRRERLCEYASTRIALNGFNPRSRAGSDRASRETMPICASFNPRSRAGSDASTANPDPDPVPVSIHAPAQGATRSRCPGRDGLRVSIHAPAQGATAAGTATRRPSWFQSTLPRRERRPARSPGTSSVSFNPRSRAGSDDVLGLFSRGGQVSIHAPAQGATCSRMFYSTRLHGFNPRSRAGSDCEGRLLLTRHSCFNPRSRAGSDALRLSPLKGRRGFNPRSRAGSDFVREVTIRGCTVSIHAPAQGATRVRGICCLPL